MRVSNMAIPLALSTLGYGACPMTTRLFSSGATAMRARKVISRMGRISLLLLGPINFAASGCASMVSVSIDSQECPYLPENNGASLRSSLLLSVLAFFVGFSSLLSFEQGALCFLVCFFVSLCSYRLNPRTMARAECKSGALSSYRSRQAILDELGERSQILCCIVSFR